MHAFFFKKGIWLGEGKIHFALSSDSLAFYTKWEVEEIKEESIQLLQKVEMQGMDQTTKNAYTVSNIDESSFAIELYNEMLGKVEGKGLYTKDTISWKFALPGIFEGFEWYEKKGPFLYNFHAEYTADALFKTIIDGIIWKKDE